MRIPISRGREAPQAQMQSFTPNTGLAEIGRSIGNIAEKQKQDQIKKDDLTASTIVSQFGLDAENMGAEYRQKVASGMSATDADLEFSKEYGLKMDEVIAQLPTSVSQGYKENLVKYGAGQVGTFYQTERNVAGDLARTNLKLTLENGSKMRDQEAALPLVENAFNAAADYLSPAEVIEFRANYKQQQQSNDIGYRLASAKTVQDYQKIYDELQDERNYDGLPGSTRNSVMHSAQSGILRIQKQEQQAHNKKEADAVKLVNALQSNVLSGGKIDLEYMTNIGKATEGTAAYSDFQFLQENYVKIQEFQNLSTNDKKVKLDQLERDFKNTPSDNASDRKKLLDLYRSSYNQDVSDAKSNNVSAAGKLGIEVSGFTGQQLLSDPAGTMGLIVNNLHALNQAKKIEPNISLDPIPSLNKADIQESFEKASANKKLDVLASIMKGSQKNRLSLSATKEIIKTIGGGDGIYNIAAVAVANNAVYHGKNTGHIILSGASLIKAGNQITPKSLETDYRSKLSNLSGDGDYSANWSAFKSAYAYFESEAGHHQKSETDMVDTDSFNKALDATTGGLYQQHNTSWFGTGKFKTANGTVTDWMVQKPYLMSDSGFEIAVNSGFEQIAKKHNLSPDFVKDNYRLQARPGSTYDRNVIYDLLDADGKQWNVNGRTQMIIVTNKRR
ncbi:hypothetical protein [Acinetobacter baumannii]|uniref:Methyl-coenzyme M reductase n=1 Tax=Acinetobacter baumannii TaxID=470 RepID=A0A6I4HM99_ACIBA|nr:hypothetical protein [Acinetobacter baumannii]KAF0626468.1 hypothetical protein AB71198_03131 [Acinetobacter baumannii]KQK37491.1 hypothetical protein AQ483_02580 [Acinetobacter baumannii]MBF6871024.1 hypothetical protein [Acinetobacter baumannii]MDC4028947.1 hypothetical protein [Acinetobacter baumannii]MDC4044937.1 hypothetical protein [Acinetobacter baumannii]